MVYQDRGSCRCQTLPKILGYSLMTYSEPLSICFVLFNIRIPAAHSAFILSHHSLGLTLLPSRLILCMSVPSALHYYLPALFFACRGQLVAAAGFGTYLVASGCTYGLGTVSFHSFSLSVSFDAVSIRYTYRLAPWLLYLLSDLNKCFCLLTGIISIRPSAFVEGAGFEPAMSQISRCHLAVGNSSLPSSSRPTFQICLS